MLIPACSPRGPSQISGDGPDRPLDTIRANGLMLSSLDLVSDMMTCVGRLVLVHLVVTALVRTLGRESTR